MANIQAIETEYKGYRMRSRLEARWAVFFDAMKIEWKYETGGFQAEVEDEDGTVEVVRYLPDFFLPKTKTWVEVKGSDELLAADVSKMESVIESSSPGDDLYAGLLILGEVPDPGEFGLHLHRIVRNTPGGLDFGWAFFYPGWVEVLKCSRLVTFYFPCCASEFPDWTTQTIYMGSKRGWREVQEAHRAARSARFEFGQSGALPVNRQAVATTPAVMPGRYHAILVAMIDLGSQRHEFEGTVSQRPKMFLVYELSKGQLIATDITLSLNEKAKLRQWIEARIGQRIADGTEYDITEEVGKHCTVTVEATTGGYPKIKSVGPYTAPNTILLNPKNRPVIISMDDFKEGVEIPDWVPRLYGEKIEDVIRRSPEFSE